MIRLFIVFSFLIFLPSILLAHGSHGSGLMAGFTHPILGIDHAIALFGTGILALFLDHKFKWFYTALIFILAMIIGGYLGINNEATFLIEKIIAASVLLIGLFIGMNKKINLVLILVSISIFGFFHGFAHGAEMPEATQAIKYIPGFALGALLMASLGMVICKFLISKSNPSPVSLFLSGLLVGMGFLILIS